MLRRFLAASLARLLFSTLAAVVLLALGLVLGPTDVAYAATITVTSAADANPPVNTDGCTLREAILAANLNAAQNECPAGSNLPTVDTIEFDIPGAGVRTINVIAEVPTITEAVLVDGFTQSDARPNTNPLESGSNAVLRVELNGATIVGGSMESWGLTIGGTGVTVRGLVVNRFSQVGGPYAGMGIHVKPGGDGAVIAGNYVGTDASGAVSLGNFHGITVIDATNVTIGGTDPGARNIISGNIKGFWLLGANGTKILGNYVGTDVSGTLARPNGVGVEGTHSAQNTWIGGLEAGAGNIIAFNHGDGIDLSSGAGHSIRGNSIFENGGLGINTHGAWSSPTLTSASLANGATRVTGTQTGTPFDGYVLDFYANPSCDPSGFGEGKTFLGSAGAIPDILGVATFNVAGLPAVPLGQAITATVTAPNGNTSGFSNCRTVVTPDVTVTPTGGLSTTEPGGTATFTVRLTSVPGGPVTIPVSSTDTTEGTVNPASLIFAADGTALNPRTVTVTGKNDATVDGDVPYTIVLGAATSADPAYNGLNPPDVSVTNKDDDAVVCSPRPRVSVTTANNGDGRMRVTLQATTIPPGTSNPLTQLQFDAGNNAVVYIPGQAPRAGPFNHDLPNQPTGYVFFVGRQHAGRYLQPFRVIDGCAGQPWSTFVGGGDAAP